MNRQQLRNLSHDEVIAVRVALARVAAMLLATAVLFGAAGFTAGRRRRG